MATKGSLAKSEVIDKIKKTFGEDFIGEVDKKVYVWANDGSNGKIQIALSLTCPKNMVAATSPAEDFNWDDGPLTPAVTAKPAEITPEEEENIAEMMRRLGL